MKDLPGSFVAAGLLMSYLFHPVMLPYQVGDVPLTLASFFARLFKMTNFAVKHSIMTPEMVENFCNDYYIPDEVHPVAPGRDKTITQFPEVLGPHAAGGSSSAAAHKVSAPEVSAPAEVEPESVVPEDTYLDLTGPDEVVVTQSGKSKRKRLGEQSDTLPAKQLRKDHPSLATGTGEKTLARLRQLMPISPLVLRPSFQTDTHARITDVPVYTDAATFNVGAGDKIYLESRLLDGADLKNLILEILLDEEWRRAKDDRHLLTDSVSLISSQRLIIPRPPVLSRSLIPPLTSERDRLTSMLQCFKSSEYQGILVTALVPSWISYAEGLGAGLLSDCGLSPSGKFRMKSKKMPDG
ncbi:hypothetical protein Tco_0708674 [Tanacetum coccineum]